MPTSFCCGILTGTIVARQSRRQIGLKGLYARRPLSDVPDVLRPGPGEVEQGSSSVGESELLCEYACSHSILVLMCQMCCDLGLQQTVTHLGVCEILCYN